MRDNAQLQLFGPETTDPPQSKIGGGAPEAHDLPRNAFPTSAVVRPHSSQIATTAPPVQPQKFQPISIDDIDFARDIVDLVSGLLPSSGLAIVYGPSGSGKSFAVLDVALHVATGRPYAGRKVRSTGVIYIAAEGDEGFRRRLVAARDRLGATKAPFAMIADAPNLGRAPYDVEHLLRVIRFHTTKAGWTPGLVVIDTLARVMPGLDENSSRDMGTLIAEVDRIGRELGCLMLVVHHTGKNEGGGMRGSSALRGAADAVWSIGFENGVRVVSLEKSRDGRDSLRWSFCLEEVVIAESASGEAITTCVVVDVTQPTPVSGRGAAKSETPRSKKLFIHDFDVALAEHGEDIRPDGNNGPHVRAVRRDVVRDEFMKRPGSTKPDSRRRTFERMLKDAVASETVASVDYKGVRYLVRP